MGLAPLLIISPGPPRLALGRGRLWEEVSRPRFPESMSLNLALGPLPLVLYFCHLPGSLAPLVAQMVKNLPAIQETWGRPLGREDLQEKEMATHSSQQQTRFICYTQNRQKTGNYFELEDVTREIILPTAKK